MMGQLMLKKGLKERLGPIYFFCAYILLERRRPDPEERDFGAFLDLLPEDCGQFPIFFNEDELSYLDGSPLKEQLLQM